MWSLEDYNDEEEVRNIVAKVIENPKDYVVKPQKEGGGNNFYDHEAADLLKKFTAKDIEEKEFESMKQFMIMERINPPMIKAWMLKDGTINEVDSLSELGLYSFVLIDTSKKDEKSDDF